MTGLQDKFFRQLCELAKKDYGFEVVTSMSASNVGHLYLQKPDKFATYLDVGFSFQPGRVTFDCKEVDLFPERANPRFAVMGAAELDEAIDAMLRTAWRELNDRNAASFAESV